MFLRVDNGKRHCWVSVGRSPLLLLLTIKEVLGASLVSLRKSNIFFTGGVGPLHFPASPGFFVCKIHKCHI